MIENLVLYISAFVLIWIGAGFAIKSVEKLSSLLRLSSFAVSFLVLGIFTSIGEFSVGINSVLDNDPEIFVGNLIGASIVIFMMIVPLLAITGNSLKINPEFRGQNLIISLLVVSLPTLLVLDGVITRTDSLIAMFSYVILVICIQKKKGFFEKLATSAKKPTHIYLHIVKILVAVGIILFASNIVVDQTIYFSELWQVSPFLISLLVISIGTNIPELSFVAQSVFMKNNQVAFGDYVGSAAFNTFLFGLLSFLYHAPIQLNNSYLSSLVFLLVGLSSFFVFARSKNMISRKEGLALLFIYILFLLSEVLLHSSKGSSLSLFLN